ncbi:MAG: outer membrane protein transport protein [Rhodospirillales bacterium]|nr:outer membrane protein transport protein [Rhodospirillales bacterium]
MSRRNRRASGATTTGLALGSVLFAAALYGGAAHASGAQVRPGDPDWAANAFAGMAAKAYDASTAWSNPAGMTELSTTEVDLGLNGLFTNITFSGSNLLGGKPIAGSDGGNAGGALITPSFAAVWAVTPRLRLGLAVETPFGDSVVYPSDFVGRYQAGVSSIRDIEIGPVIAYRLSPSLSVGGGPIIDHFAARLTTAINTGPTAALTGDPALDVSSGDWSVGYHLGVLWKPLADWRFGIDYRSRIRNAMEGTQSVFIPPLLAALSPPAAGALAALATPVRTVITVPDVLTLGAVWQINPHLAALGTVQWTDWAVIPSIAINGLNGSQQTLQLHFHASWMGSVGLNWSPASVPGLMLQMGTGLDESPATDASRTPRLPTMNEALLGFGAQYAVSPAVTLKASFLHEFGFGPGGVNYSATPSAGILNGIYSTGVSVVGVGVGVKF